MKTIKTKLVSAIVAFSLCAGMLTFSACKSDEEDDMIDDTPCAQLECKNGGNAIKDVEFDTCRCICPTGYTGANCETKKP
jgi:hypothetical protein